MRARCDHDDGNAAGAGVAFADGEVQVFDFVGDAFFERVGNDLRELGGALGGRVAIGGQHFAGRHDDRDAPARCSWRSPARARRTPR